MTDAPPLVDADEVRGEVRVPVAVTDEVIADRVARAEARVRRYCRWHVWPQISETVSVDTSGDWSLLLPTLRIVDVDAVTISGAEVDVSSVSWSEDGRLRRRDTRFPDLLRGATVTLTHGYDPDEIDDVRDVLMGMIGRALTLPVGISQSSTGDKSVTYAVEASLRPTLGDKETLNEFRIRR